MTFEDKRAELAIFERMADARDMMQRRDISSFSEEPKQRIKAAPDIIGSRQQRRAARKGNR